MQHRPRFATFGVRQLHQSEHSCRPIFVQRFGDHDRRAVQLGKGSCGKHVTSLTNTIISSYVLCDGVFVCHSQRHGRAMVWPWPESGYVRALSPPPCIPVCISCLGYFLDLYNFLAHAHVVSWRVPTYPPSKHKLSDGDVKMETEVKQKLHTGKLTREAAYRQEQAMFASCFLTSKRDYRISWCRRVSASGQSCEARSVFWNHASLEPDNSHRWCSFLLVAFAIFYPSYFGRYV